MRLRRLQYCVKRNQILRIFIRELKFAAMKVIVLSVCLLVITGSVFAQKNMLGTNLKVYDPLSGFSKNIGALPAGLSMNYLRSFENNKFSVGAEIGVAMYSSNTYTIDYKGETLEVSEEDCFWTAHTTVRYDVIRTDNFITYAEVKVGVTTFFSSIDAFDTETDYKGEFSFHGTAFNSGLGGGIMIKPSYIFNQPEKPGRVWLNVGAILNSGSNTDYRYMPKGESGINTSLADGQYESLTHYVGYKFGVLFQF